MVSNNQRVECDDGFALNSFKYEIDEVNKKTRYLYECIEVDCHNKTDKKTMKNMYGNLAYLDRHSVFCDGSYIVGFTFHLDCCHHSYYEYKCCTPKVTKSLTSIVNDVKGRNIYKDDIYIKCTDDGALSMFKLERDQLSGKQHYRYHCMATKN